MTEAYVFDAVRSPRGRGKKDGSLHGITPVHLLSTLFHAVEQRNHLDTAQVDDVVLGCVTPIGEQGADIARTAVLYAGWAQNVPGVTQSRFCASGLESVNLAAQKVRSGFEDLVVAGGVEMMSRWAMGSDGGAWAMDPRANERLGFAPQGVGADLIATLEGFSRTDVDSFAVRSQDKAIRAQHERRFDKSIIPTTDVNGMVVLDHDEHVRPGTTVESLAGLKPSFAQLGAMGFDSTALNKYTTVDHIDHVHHAGNSSGIVDGAALVLIGSEEKGRALGLKPRARIVSTAVIGSEPTIMLTGIAPSCQKALKKAGMSVKDIDLIEINEAFAAVVMKALRVLGVDEDENRTNVNGGAIALGHPLGATGAMLLGTMVDELERRDLSTAMISLCVGGGMGIATIIERV
ncbi:MAG: acetyl-CoA C-acetyltransferase [Nevskiaceae bacterium]|nr:MAG: acetyl-CoA C-acetyltransferase [Nevskiaceae bacterium]TBR74466.1 MAG: acetyl-CoA C-acetyltransferase [Nevskiaceae bacterium]